MSPTQEDPGYSIVRGKLASNHGGQILNYVTTCSENGEVGGPYSVCINDATVELRQFDVIICELELEEGCLKAISGEFRKFEQVYSDLTDYFQTEFGLENDQYYFAQGGKLLVYHAEHGLRNLTHIKRLTNNGWDGTLEVRMFGNAVELWLDADAGSDPHYDEETELTLCHKLTVNTDYELEGNVDGSFVYVFVFLDQDGNEFEEHADGMNLMECKRSLDPNPILGRLLLLMSNGYEFENAFTGGNVANLNERHARSNHLDGITLKHPSNRPYLTLALLVDGTLRRPSYHRDVDDFSIGSDDEFGFAEFIRAIPKPKALDKLFPQHGV